MNCRAAILLLFELSPNNSRWMIIHNIHGFWFSIVCAMKTKGSKCIAFNCNVNYIAVLFCRALFCIALHHIASHQTPLYFNIFFPLHYYIVRMHSIAQILALMGVFSVLPLYSISNILMHFISSVWPDDFLDDLLCYFCGISPFPKLTKSASQYQK